VKQPIATIAERCPWCRVELDGRILASFRNGKLTSLSQTRIIGSHEYTWSHSEDGCRVPSLDRISPVTNKSEMTVDASRHSRYSLNIESNLTT